jgi:hypothetical protein
VTRGEAAAVRLRVVWVASRNGGRHGRVVVQRTVTGEARPVRFWLSGPMPAAALVGATRAGTPQGWHDLLLGLPVGDLTTPVPLRPAARADLDQLSVELAGSEAVAVVQRLLLAAAELVAGAAVSARVVRFTGDVLAHAFDGVLEGPPPGLVLGKATVEGPAAAQEPGTGSAADAWIPLAEVAAAGPVEGRGRVTTLVLKRAAGPATGEASAPDGALAGPLAAPGVADHVAALAADASDAAARRRLVGALDAAGWWVRSGTSSVDVGGAGLQAVVELLDGLLVLVVRDPGDPDTGDRVTLVGPTRAASALLRSHERLAAALADHLAPPAGVDDAAVSGADRAAARIARRRELRAALREAAAGSSGSSPRGPA